MAANKNKDTYAEAGVDIDAGNRFVKLIKPLVSKTFKPGVMTGIGGFSGLFSLSLQDIKNPVLVSSTDGVGTKLKIAFMMDKHDTVGIDLVAMSVNDVLVQGATPLFMLDYIATGKLEVEKTVQIVKGIAAGCEEGECSLIGGETAEMPASMRRGIRSCRFCRGPGGQTSPHRRIKYCRGASAHRCRFKWASQQRLLPGTKGFLRPAQNVGPRLR